MNRTDILTSANEIVNKNRENDYGAVENNFKTISQMWNAYLHLDNAIAPKDVAAMMALLKIARISSGHNKSDNWIDLAGYAACGGELETSEKEGM